MHDRGFSAHYCEKHASNCAEFIPPCVGVVLGREMKTISVDLNRTSPPNLAHVHVLVHAEYDHPFGARIVVASALHYLPRSFA
jgi:hypothetical protein